MSALVASNVKREFKTNFRSSDQELRRQVALRRQKSSRESVMASVRNVSQTSPEQAMEPLQFPPAADVSVNVDMVHTEPAAQQSKRKRHRSPWARQLMIPEWLVQVPQDLCAQRWNVLPRPEGKRCLVISCGGVTISRLRSGQTLHSFQSMLPNGNSSARNKDNSCILDCIFHEAQKAYYVLDLIAWYDYTFHDCTTEFRIFWLHSKLSEHPQASFEGPSNDYRFLPIPVYDCSPEGLYAAYTTQYDFVKDGLLFYNKEAHYTPGITPLVLAWSDPSTSRYFIESSDGVNPTPLNVTVYVRKSGALMTMEDFELGTLTSEFMSANHILPGDLVRFTLTGIDLSKPQPAPENLQYIGKVSSARGNADSWTRVQFQYRARNCPIVFEELIRVAQAPVLSALESEQSYMDELIHDHDEEIEEDEEEAAYVEQQPIYTQYSGQYSASAEVSMQH